MSNKNVLDINQVHVVESYPYGRLRTKASFSIEFVKRKGFRTVFQTVNPKNGRVNAPKKSTYYHFAYNFLADDGKTMTGGFNINSNEGVNKLAAFIAEYQPKLNLTPEMMQEVYSTMLSIIRIGASYQSKFDNIATEKITAIIDGPVTTLIEGYKNGTDVFAKINVDVDALNALKTNS